jgi:hypothetical protein
MRKLKSVVLFTVAIIALAGGSNQVVFGDTLPSDRTVVILADRQAMIGSEGGMDLMRSFLGLVSTLKEGQNFIYIAADDPTKVLGPVPAGEPAFRAFQESVFDSIAIPGSGPGTDYMSALTETFNLLGARRAVSGSSVYLMTGGDAPGDRVRVADRLSPLLALFESNDWPIVALGMPGTSSEMQGFLTEISVNSGGDAFVLSIPDGFKSLSDIILRDEARGSLTELAGDVLSLDQVLTSDLSVAPGTGELTLLFFKEGPYGSLRLSNPSGLEASAGDRTASSVLETPHIVIWRLIDPAPGQWKVDVRGVEGVVSAWHIAATRYGVALVPYGAIPTDEPSTLVAYVTDGPDKAVVDGVKIVARITSSEGSVLEHELNDDGTLGDSVAGDGYFSATIPPVQVEGNYEVELLLSWPEYGHQISSGAGFTAQAFPAVELTPIQTDELRPNERSKIATLLVHVRGQPYAVSADELSLSLASNAEQPGLIELTPQSLLGQGRAWQYDVFFTPAEEGLHTLVVRLTMEYAGRQYTYSTNSTVLSSVIPVAAAAPSVQTAQPPPIAPTPAVQTPLFRPDVKETGFPWTLLIVSLAAGVVVASIALYLGTRTRPYGYIYNDRNEPVVDFSNLKRNPVIGFLFRNSVGGKELGVSDLEGVSFDFSGERIGLRSRRGMQTVRVNNQPLIGRATIQDRAWIGTHGRLYSFIMSPSGLRAEPSPGDDD